ncbi:FAD binding domain-containing protein [Spongiactinospora sp. TRM90649]|uniref:FAD binding domain-containing protein n=1 Tax=Spongiactinospora sp. TRM90649 TaxID=3031114 RepID=UPI0023F9C4FF|nr:FAD binding domain-containing protein [Spongiactinospora sp. TRM90649]MDF5756775.1 FAD binding domain-containing protein [Spongiactinospora sp. TRM90649]
MDFIRPANWAEALAAKAERPAALPVQGGTDVMVEINFDRRRPDALLDLNPVDELRHWTTAPDGTLRVGAGVPYHVVIGELGGPLPGLAQASRTVGSPQIRNRATVGGNLGSGSPAGDCHPPLLAAEAVIEVASAARGTRMIPADRFYLGPKRTALAADELIAAIHVRPAAGPQYFAKVGTRNAMVIAVCSFAVALNPAGRRVGTGIGSAAPTPLRAVAAEEYLAGALDWSGPLDPAVAGRFGELVAAAASPIDDVRGTAGYRRHALAVLARRTLTWAWHDYREAG